MQDICLSALLSLLFFIGAVLTSNAAKELRKLFSDIEILDHLGVDNTVDLRDSLAATAVG